MHTLGLSSPALSHVIFISNTTTGAAGSGHGYGGGMFNAASSKPTLTDAVFTGNAAVKSGGGLSNASSLSTMGAVTFTANSAVQSGGAVFLDPAAL